MIKYQLSDLGIGSRADRTSAELRLKAKVGAVISICVLIGAASLAGLAQSGASSDLSFSTISKSEIELLLSEVAKSNPKILERLAQDPGMIQAQIESLKQLLALASQAQREGLSTDPTNRQELENIRHEVIATNYDREINKGKSSSPVFGNITKNQIAAYWLGGAGHEAEFTAFLNAKLEILRNNDSEKKSYNITAEEREQARDSYAKIRIYSSEYDAKEKAALLPKVFVQKVDLQVRLQQAQFLSRLLSEKNAERFIATDADIAEYIADNSDLDPKPKRAIAQGILDRAKAGENFAALANEFSEDPGNVGTDGKKKGGIYRDIPEGRMVAPFEKAALSLNAGQVSPELVETDFGFHVIKLEKKGLSKDPAARGQQVYDARHILISTSVDNSQGRSIPLKDYVREQIESAREAEYIERLVAEHKIQVPEDFDIPSVAQAKPITKKPLARKKAVRKRK
jgi:hypothetical protein